MLKTNKDMKQRFDLSKEIPDGYEKMLGLENYLRTTGLSSTDKHLIKIRASQINGCAYCIDMHTKEARHSGETEQRIYALNAWQESPLFNDRERLVLELTEELTLIHTRRFPDSLYEEAVRVLGQEYLNYIIMANVAINGWNRIAVASRLMPRQTAAV